MSKEPRPPIFRMAPDDVWEFPKPNMDLVPELIKYSAATVSVVARGIDKDLEEGLKLLRSKQSLIVNNF